MTVTGTSGRGLATDMELEVSSNGNGSARWPAAEVRRGYPQLPRFIELCRQLDPSGRFRDAFLDEFVFGRANCAQPSMELGSDGTSTA